ncbi:MAG: tRNA (N(6)-L-threonylcarbamoyladenosine(37)-C(2))-methylthiotransferase MtaB [Ignavibacteriae bacterium]|nr:tRNA (N(6)-L-threonylcarbamoyladenosine(37)-C(2))-methylthiotransferase MtaB [Ignavibacteriota bacterium]
MKKVAFHTLGCKLNFAETSTIGRQFVDRGFEVVDVDDPFDVFILNTCSVTERADRECRQLIRRALRHSPDAYVVVVGCYAQLQPEKIASIDGVDLVVGTKEKFRIFDYAGDFIKHSTPHVFVSCIDDVTAFDPAYSADVGGRTRAFLKVQDGCDYHCAFCTIPLARGESRSQPIDAVLQQASLLAAHGYKELVLSGVNVGDYGKKIGTTLFELMKALEQVRDIQRIRISSIEPNLLTREMVDFMLSSGKFCNHFHIPLQSGNDVILKRMRRRYLTGDYRNLIEYIKERDSAACIGADIIVGFPGETDTLFEETHRFLVDLPLSYLHVFTYSERSNTPAIVFNGIVEPKIRQQRSEMLRRLGYIKRHAFYSSFIGKDLPVLFESKVHHRKISGLTANYIRVEVPSQTQLVNEIHDVFIEEVNGDVCRGVLQRETFGSESEESAVMTVGLE